MNTNTKYALPDCNIPMSSNQLFDKIGHNQSVFVMHNMDDFQKVSDIIKFFIGGDCKAVTVSTPQTEILFNHYAPNATLKEHIFNNIVHTSLAKNPISNILQPIRKMQVNATLNIYMFMDYPWRVRFYYDSANISMQAFISDAYKQRFGEHDDASVYTQEFSDTHKQRFGEHDEIPKEKDD